tara:strand:- start:6894 stop:7568 length:675 start_codon:yes stop_codon:yes gene_type:complete
MHKITIKKTIKKNIGGSSSRSRSHHASSGSRKRKSSSRSRPHHAFSRSISNKIRKLDLRKIDVDQNEPAGRQLKNIKNIFDGSYKCYSIKKSFEGRLVEKWLNWLLPIKPDVKEEYKTINCPYGEFLIWTIYQILDNNLVEKYKDGYFFLREMFTGLEENAYTGIFQVTKEYEKLYNKLKATNDLKKIFFNNYPERKKQYGKNHITISNTAIVALLELLYDKKN